jgi:uncharacterized protein YdeI (YjbR/CyaY-like superfamily)
MPKKDPRVDAYITKAGDFAKPILNRIRKLVHQACPPVEEAIKWNMPFFEYKGILVAMPAFRQHCALIFWKGKLILGKDRAKFRRLTSLADLPPDKTLLELIGKAVALNEAGIKAPVRAKPNTAKVVVPVEILAALKKNKKALAGFEKLPPSHKREYVEWVAEAKREETRARRLSTMLKWLAQGKSRNWKYE